MRCRSGRGEREVGVIFKKGFSSVLVGEGRKQAEQSRAERGGRAGKREAGGPHAAAAAARDGRSRGRGAAASALPATAREERLRRGFPFPSLSLRPVNLLLLRLL